MRKVLNELVTIGTTVKFGTNPSDDGVHDELNAASANLKAAVSGAKGAADELADVFGNIVKSVEANNGEMPDVNDLVRRGLEDELKELVANGGDEIRINELRNILMR